MYLTWNYLQRLSVRITLSETPFVQNRVSGLIAHLIIAKLLYLLHPGVLKRAFVLLYSQHSDMPNQWKPTRT